MDEGMAVAAAALIAVVAQSFFLMLEARRGRLERAMVRQASARLVRDVISARLEATHASLVSGRWWPDQLEADGEIALEDRRALAGSADAEALRRAFGSLRRFGQLRRSRAARSSDELSEDELVEVAAVFFDLGLARRLLSPYTGYGTAPFARPVDIAPAIQRRALAAAGIDSADGLYRRATTPAPA